MELYELWPSTVEILKSLRERRNDGWVGRRTGKTTALLIYAKELLDKGERVYIMGVKHQDLLREYIKIHKLPARVPRSRGFMYTPLPITVHPHVDFCGFSGWLLIDEQCVVYPGIETRFRRTDEAHYVFGRDHVVVTG